MKIMNQQNQQLMEIVALNMKSKSNESRNAGCEPSQVSAGELAKAVACARMDGDTTRGAEWWPRVRSTV